MHVKAIFNNLFMEGIANYYADKQKNKNHSPTNLPIALLNIHN